MEELLLVLLLLLFSPSIVQTQLSKPIADDKSMEERIRNNKFLSREASDDLLGYPNLDEEALANTQCPRHVELRWQTEVSASVYATPVIADINGDGKLDILVPSFVHYLDVLEGADGEKIPGWPAFHQSIVHSSPLVYDIDKDGLKEVLLPTYNGDVLIFRSSGFQSSEKLIVPKLRVKKDWYVGLRPDHANRSPDIHDDGLISSSGQDRNASANVSLGNRSTSEVPPSVNNVGVETGNMGDNQSTLGSASLNSTHQALRRLLELTDKEKEATVDDKQEMLEEVAENSFNVFRDQGGHELSDEYSYDYDDYVDESMWGDDLWHEMLHEKEEDFINVDAHILCSPVIADIDKDGIDEMIVAASFFFDREYYESHASELGTDIDIGKYIAGAIVVFNLDTKQVKWKAHLDLSTESVTSFHAYIYSPPTVVDLDGDGYLSILVGTSMGFVYALHHNGSVRANFPLEMGEIHGQVVAADINDDGKIEIVTADTRGNVATWERDGKLLWEAHLKSLIAQAPTVGDVNGDGKTDVVIPTASGNIYVLKGSDGSVLPSYPFRTHGRVMSSVLLTDFGSRDDEQSGLTMVATSFDGYMYIIEGKSGCADAIDIGETSYAMVLADNVDGGDDLDLVVATMNGNVFCFQTPVRHHPLKAWPMQAHGRNVMALRHGREGVYALPSSRRFRDEAGDSFLVQFKIVDQHGLQGPYNVTVSLLVPGNYQGPRTIAQWEKYERAGVEKMKLPCVAVRSMGTVRIEMVDKHGLYFFDEFALTFHMHYYRLLKWLIVLPMLGVLTAVVGLHSQDEAALPS